MDVRAALVPAIAAVLLSGCAAGQEPGDTAAAPAPVSSVPPATAGTAAPAPPPAVRTVAVSYAGGEVTGSSGREQVAVGEQLVLRISSDVPEQVHVHGYDLQAAVPAGGSVDIPLTADLPGVFEVELHDSGKVLFQLGVA